MTSAKKLPDEPVLRRLAEEGKTNKQIAEKYGVTPEAVRLARQRFGIPQVRRGVSHAHYLPWSVQASQANDFLARRLRQYSKVQQGIALPPDDERLLRKWQEWMDGGNPWGVPLSVHYDRRDPDGFWLEPRRDGDRDYISPPSSSAA